MKKQKYIYNPKTLQFEKERISFSQILKRTSLYSFSIIAIGSLLAFGIYKYIPSPQEKKLQDQLGQMEYHFNSLNDEFESMSSNLEKLHEKDTEVHRMIFGMDPIDKGLWAGGIGGHYRYNLEMNKDTEQLLSESLQKVKNLKRKLKLQSLSLDTIYNMALEKEKMLASIPSIKPVRIDKLKRKLNHLSGYGMRIHPVHKVRKFHKGIDFTAPIGTPIVATGNGKVVRVQNKRNGYGKNVIIDHGFGYSTLYAHMHTIDVKKGDKVIKGQIIGSIGNTGTSTAPHLHYEVRLNEKAINPIHYCMDELTPAEYQELVEKASIENQSFD